MGKDQVRIAVQCRKMEDELFKLIYSYESPVLTGEDRAICMAKIESVRAIFEFLSLILINASDKKKTLLMLCLTGGGNTISNALNMGYNSVDTLNKARIRLMDKLQRTVLNEEKVADLLKSTTCEEVNDVWQWYQMNVYTYKELIRSLVE
jgi:hypothetical protein